MPTSLRRCARASCVVLLAIAPSLARAEPPAQQTNPKPLQPAAAQPAAPLALGLRGPRWLERCLTAEKLASSVAKRSTDGPATQAAPLKVEVRARVPVAQETSLEIRAQQGDRSLGSRVLEVDPRDCVALPDAVGLVVVLLARAGMASAAEEAGQAAPLPTSGATPTAAPRLQPAANQAPADGEMLPLTAADRAAERGARSRPLRLALGAGAAGVSGIMPAVALRLQLEAALILERLCFRLRAAMYWPQDEPVAEGSIRVAAGELAADACLALADWAAARSGLHACVGPRAGLIEASGRGFRVQNYTVQDLRLGAGALLAFRVALTEATALRFEGGASLALRSPRLLVERSDGAQPDASTPALVSAELGLSIEQVF